MRTVVASGEQVGEVRILQRGDIVPHFEVRCHSRRRSRAASPRSVIADQWGEIVHLVAAIDVDHMPTPRELLERVEYVASRCPECEGEAK
jgi:hypothetical protein